MFFPQITEPAPIFPWTRQAILCRRASSGCPSCFQNGRPIRRSFHRSSWHQQHMDVAGETRAPSIGEWDGMGWCKCDGHESARTWIVAMGADECIDDHPPIWANFPKGDVLLWNQALHGDTIAIWMTLICYGLVQRDLFRFCTVDGKSHDKTIGFVPKPCGDWWWSGHKKQSHFRPRSQSWSDLSCTRPARDSHRGCSWTTRLVLASSAPHRIPLIPCAKAPASSAKFNHHL